MKQAPRSPTKCRSKGCRNTPPPDPAKARRAGWRDGVCSKCQHRAKKKARPFAYAYMYHKASARRRGISWGLDLDAFTAFWLEHPEAWKRKLERLLSSDTNKMRLNAAQIDEIDRKDPAKGYEPGNLQLSTKRVNVRRMWEDRSQRPTFAVEVERPGGEIEEDDLPF